MFTHLPNPLPLLYQQLFCLCLYHCKDDVMLTATANHSPQPQYQLSLHLTPRSVIGCWGHVLGQHVITVVFCYLSPYSFYGCITLCNVYNSKTGNTFISVSKLNIFYAYLLVFGNFSMFRQFFTLYANQYKCKVLTWSNRSLTFFWQQQVGYTKTTNNL